MNYGHEVNGDAIGACNGIATIVWCKDNGECVAKQIIVAVSAAMITALTEW